MGFFTIVGITTAVTNFLMTFIMLYAGKRLINLIWACFCLSVAVLGYFLTLISLTDNPQDALLYWKLAYIGVANIPVLILHTTYLMLGADFSGKRLTLIIAYIITGIFHYLNFVGYLITEVSYLFDEIYFDTPYTFSFLIFFLFFNTIFFTIFFLLFRAYQIAPPEEKKRIKFFSTGIGVGVIGGGALFLPVFGIPGYPYSAILTGFYPVIIGYAIFSHHLFDARYAFLQILRMLSIITISLAIGGGMWMGFEYIFSYTPKIQFVELSIWIMMYMTGIFFFDSEKFSGLFLIPSLAALDIESRKFLEKRGVYRNNLELLSDLEILFWKSLKIRKVSLLNSSIVSQYPECIAYFKKYKKPLVRSELESEKVEGENYILFHEVRKIGDTIFPVDTGVSDSYQFLVLGPKESEDHMTEAELSIISRIIPKIAISLQIIEYNHSLQTEVKIQTHAIAQKNEELKQANKKLKEIDKNKDNFLAIASHELRTPMTVIKGYADLFLKNALGPMNPDQIRYLKKIYESSESLIGLVNNILDISKIEAGRMEVHRSEMNAREVVEGCIENIRDLCRDKSLEIGLNSNLKRESIVTDPEKFRLVLANLLSNAYKFTPSGGKITVQLSEKEGRLVVSVKDTGMGIPPERLPTVFEKFNQSENMDYTKKSIKGTGLGLNLAKQIMDLLSGTIAVQSKVGKGTTFLFTLPF